MSNLKSTFSFIWEDHAEEWNYSIKYLPRSFKTTYCELSLLFFSHVLRIRYRWSKAGTGYFSRLYSRKKFRWNYYCCKVVCLPHSLSSPVLVITCPCQGYAHVFYYGGSNMWPLWRHTRSLRWYALYTTFLRSCNEHVCILHCTVVIFHDVRCR